MSLLVRKVERASWQPADQLHVGIISADTITCDMRTKGNALSVYRIDTEANLDEAILALVTHPHRKDLDAIDVLCLDPKILQTKGFQLKQTEGQTVVTDLKNTHHDIIDLTYYKLGIMAEIILGQIQQKDTITISASDIAKKIWEAIQQKRFEFTILDKKFKEVLKDRFVQLGYDTDELKK